MKNELIQFSVFKEVYARETLIEFLQEMINYQQLKMCGLPEEVILKHIQYSFYFQAFMMDADTNLVNDILLTAFDNFEWAVLKLQKEGRDTPFNRLYETKLLSNSYAPNEQVKFGAIIYLLLDCVDNQITLGDDNE